MYKIQDDFYTIMYDENIMEEVLKMDDFEYQFLKALKEKNMTNKLNYKIWKNRKHELYILIDQFQKRGIIEQLSDEERTNLETMYDGKIPFNQYWLTKEGYEIYEACTMKREDQKLIKIQTIVGIISIIISIISIIAMICVGLLSSYIALKQ